MQRVDPDNKLESGDGRRDLELEKWLADPKRGYTCLQILGQGSYGIVYSCRDEKTGKKVAIKTVKNLFDRLEMSKCIARELGVLMMCDHPNINPLQAIIPPDDLNNFNQISFVLQLEDTDLANTIESKQKLSPEHVQYFIHQLLSALKYLDEACILHRDIKPGNILVNANCHLRLADFGLSRLTKTPSNVEAEVKKIPFLSAAKPPKKLSHHRTGYVVTRWYRAPEIMLSDAGCLAPQGRVNDSNYGSSVDIWSVGLVLLQLLLRVADLNIDFMHGEDTVAQLMAVFDLVGTESDLQFIDKTKRADAFECMRDNTMKNKSRNLEGRLKVLNDKLRACGASPDAMAIMQRGFDLVRQVLRIGPAKRITVTDALNHPFVRGFQYEQKSKPSFLPQLKTSSGLTVAGASAVRQSQLEMDSNLNRATLRAYFVEMINNFSGVFSSLKEEKATVPAAGAAMAAPAAVGEVKTSAPAVPATVSIASRVVAGEVKIPAVTTPRVVAREVKIPAVTTPRVVAREVKIPAATTPRVMARIAREVKIPVVATPRVTAGEMKIPAAITPRIITREVRAPVSARIMPTTMAATPLAATPVASFKEYKPTVSTPLATAKVGAPVVVRRRPCRAGFYDAAAEASTKTASTKNIVRKPSLIYRYKPGHQPDEPVSAAGPRSRR